MRTLPSSGNKRPGATDPTRGYANQDGPGNTTINYGPHRGGFSFSGLTSPRWDDRDPAFDYTPEKLAAEAAARQPYIDRRNALLGGDDAYQQAKASGDMRGMIAAMTRLKQQGQQDRFVAQGGTPETWQHRYDNENNWPRPTSSIGYSHGPGRPDYDTRFTNPSPYGPGNSAPPGTPQGGGVRRGATPQANVPMSAGMPPSQNPMFEGYLGGGAGVTNGPGGWGRSGGMPRGGGDPLSYLASGPGWDGQAFNPGGGGMGGGNPFGAGPRSGGDWLTQPGGPFGASTGGGETGMMYGGGGMGGGVSPQLLNMSMQMRGGGAMGAMPFSRNMGMMGGGYNPYAGFGMY